jgi:hypothetical protein
MSSPDFYAQQGRVKQTHNAMRLPRWRVERVEQVQGRCRLEPYTVEFHNAAILLATWRTDACISMVDGRLPKVATSCRNRTRHDALPLRPPLNGHFALAPTKRRKNIG